MDYKDPVLQARTKPGGDPEQRGDRLRDLLLRKAWTSARELVETVLAEVDGYLGSDLRVEDQTLVAVVRRL